MANQSGRQPVCEWFEEFEPARHVYLTLLEDNWDLGYCHDQVNCSRIDKIPVSTY